MSSLPQQVAPDGVAALLIRIDELTVNPSLVHLLDYYLERLERDKESRDW